MKKYAKGYHRTKGHDAERAIVNLIKSFGITAKRISMMESGGIDKGDVLIDNKWIGSVKIGKQCPLWLYSALGDAHFAFARRDKSKWIVMMPIDVFENLLQMAR